MIDTGTKITENKISCNPETISSSYNHKFRFYHFDHYSMALNILLTFGNSFPCKWFEHIYPPDRL